ncbi:MAG: DMT family transporter [candidate division WOR-3 bacterium]|nr:DMT family transporter [candidate division WOR-3 bacterium]
MPYLGEIAGIGTAILWAANAIFFAEGAKRTDALSVSILRLILASVILTVLHLALGGRFNFQLDAVLWLGASGIVALAVGDWFLFSALGKIGPRIVMLVMSASPVFAALIAWIFLGETLGLMAIVGIALVVGGICLVVLNKKGNEHLERKNLVTGVIFSVLAAIGQGSGLVIAKHGMSLGVGEIDATMIRVLSATAVVAVFTLIIGRGKRVAASARNAKAMLFVALGTTIGLIMGTLLAFVSINNTEVGVGATLISLSPLILLPASRIIYRERITLIAVIGTIVTIAGVALLMLR